MTTSNIHEQIKDLYGIGSFAKMVKQNTGKNLVRDKRVAK